MVSPKLKVKHKTKTGQFYSIWQKTNIYKNNKNNNNQRSQVCGECTSRNGVNVDESRLPKPKPKIPWYRKERLTLACSMTRQSPRHSVDMLIINISMTTTEKVLTLHISFVDFRGRNKSAHLRSIIYQALGWAQGIHELTVQSPSLQRTYRVNV